MNKKGIFAPLSEWTVESASGCSKCKAKTKLTLHEYTMQALCKKCKPFFEDDKVIIR